MTKPPDARERYLAIAARCFAEAGFHGVSLASLAKEAGVSKQALLHFFSTKEKLYGETLAALSTRLCEEIDAATGAPEQRLAAYFKAHAERSFARPADVQLVLRALMDSREQARRWPLKAYLDRLVDMAQQTPAWKDAPREQTLAGLYQLIGALQYFAISKTTLAGMYGEPASEAAIAQFRRRFEFAVRDFLRGPLA